MTAGPANGAGAPPAAASVPQEAGGIRIRRAWPRADGTQTVEGHDGDGRLRAGTWHGAGARLDVLDFGRDAKLPALPGVLAPGAELIVHRAGRRAVVRSGDRYVKVLRPGRAAGVAEASTRLGELVRDAGGASATVLETGNDRVVFDTVRGVPLRSLQGPGDLARWRAAWQEFARMWARLVGRTPPAGAGGNDWARHDAQAEADVVLAWVGNLRGHDPLGLGRDETERLEERARRAVSGLLDGAGDRLVPAHRDLHDEQLLYDPAAGRIGVLDFDTAALAEPALDLGNLMAHLALRHDQGLISGPARDAARDVLAEAAEGCGVSAARLAAYENATRLRLVGVYAFRPPWRQLARDWLRVG
ncbi:phosphotransferase [Zhihengliuella salsuginis]|uniref:Aminoglycoside phosphotransferase domain-containing protein n=1 Tax=Zhihengliuella salsuginis TaxID=578222 RepID=A0ABQ3GJ42_9MICC|nr:phosphotransferase [Zhihengliuella salsuginis]GHD10076.1 hypothetical protein GCM10008096_23230 [Zhihengliuella salsuginis]